MGGFESREFELTDDDFFVILPTDIDLGAEIDYLEEDAGTALNLDPDWRADVREFYHNLVEFARHAKSEISEIYPELQMAIYFERVNLDLYPKTFNHAVIKIRSNHLGRRSAYYPSAKQRFAELHIERTDAGYKLYQRYYVGDPDTRESRAVANLAAKLQANCKGKTAEEVSCLAVTTTPFQARNMEASDFLENVRFYLKALDGRYFLATKIREKFAPRAKTRRVERRKKKQTRTLATLAAAREAQSSMPENHLPWFKRQSTTRMASGW